jgi:hypothetical protein
MDAFSGAGAQISVKPAPDDQSIDRNTQTELGNGEQAAGTWKRQDK